MEEIKRVSRRIEELQKRLDAIESIIPLASELVRMSERLNIPLNLYHNQIKQLVLLNGLRERAPLIEKDELSRLIIQSLLSRPGSNISQLTASVKSWRGTASRRIVAQRLGELERLGIVRHRTGQNNEKQYSLTGQERAGSRTRE
jgi:DNA-binding HxlR family transcriptional regulator